jgi:hypothetical protein
MTRYKICDSPYTMGMYIIKYKRWWFMPWLMYGHYSYNWTEAKATKHRLELLRDYKSN